MREPRIVEALRAMWGEGDPRQLLARSLRDELRQRVCADAALRLLTYFPDEGAPLVAKRIAGISWDYYPERDDAEANLLRAAVSTGHGLVRLEWLKLLDPGRPGQAQLAALAAMPGDPRSDVRERVRAMLEQPSDLRVVTTCIALLPGERAPAAFAWLERQFPKVEARDASKAQEILAALDEEGSIPIFRAHIEKLTNFGWGNVVALGEAPRPKLAIALFRAKLDVTDPVGPHGAVPAPTWAAAGTRWCDLAAAVVSDATPGLDFDRKAPVEERDKADRGDPRGAREVDPRGLRPARKDLP